MRQVIIRLFFLFLLLNCPLVHADSDLCKYFQYCGGSGGGSSRSSSQSLPSASSAAGLNPGNIAKVRGFGLETTYQANNPLVFDIVTGDGKIGALISPTQENSFFGNRSVEIDDEYAVRRITKKQYENKKLNLSVGASLIDKSKLSLDLGISVKRNPDIKKINPGVGLSGKILFLTYGAYIYKDDVKLKLGTYFSPYSGLMYSSIYNSSTYQETYNVQTYTLGTKILNLSLDAGMILTRYQFYPEETRVYLYSASYAYKKFLFNFAQRDELSSNAFYENGTLRIQREKREYYYGLQYLLNKHILLGVAYNNFLLHEISSSLTIFL